MLDFAIDKRTDLADEFVAVCRRPFATQAQPL
jgi:hypothetical protein